jgi:hypothetical protein
MNRDLPMPTTKSQTRMPRFFTGKQVAEHLGYHERTVKRPPRPSRCQTTGPRLRACRTPSRRAPRPGMRPQQIETVRMVLGHASTKTTLKAYAELNSDPAMRAWSATLGRLRSDLAERGQSYPKAGIALHLEHRAKSDANRSLTATAAIAGPDNTRRAGRFHRR